MKSGRRGFASVAVLWPVLLILYLWLDAASAHQAPCPRLHSGSSEAIPRSGATRGIDSESVITRSSNFTNVAQAKTASSLSISRDQAFAALYTQNRDARRQQSEASFGRRVRE